MVSTLSLKRRRFPSLHLSIIEYLASTFFISFDISPWIFCFFLSHIFALSMALSFFCSEIFPAIDRASEVTPSFQCLMGLPWVYHWSVCRSQRSPLITWPYTSVSCGFPKLVLPLNEEASSGAPICFPITGFLLSSLAACIALRENLQLCVGLCRCQCCSDSDSLWLFVPVSIVELFLRCAAYLSVHDTGMPRLVSRIIQPIDNLSKGEKDIQVPACLVLQWRELDDGAIRFYNQLCTATYQPAYYR